MIKYDLEKSFANGSWSSESDLGVSDVFHECHFNPLNATVANTAKNMWNKHGGIM